MNSENDKSANLAVPDSDSDIDRLFAYKLKHTPEPGSEMNRVLDELRQQHLAYRRKESKLPFWQTWGTKLILGGLGSAAMLALVVVILAALINPAKDTAGLAGQNQASSPVAIYAATPTALNTPLTNNNPTIIVTGTSTPMPLTTSDSNQPNIPASTTAKDSSSTPADSTTPLPSGASPTPVLPANLTPAGARGVAQNATSVSGTIKSFEPNARVIILTQDTGTTLEVKLTDSVIVLRDGVPTGFTDIKAGDILTADGNMNNQGQFDATTIALGFERKTRPIGDPGYPDDTK